MSIEAMKQALRVFEKAVDHLPESKIDDCINSAIALRQAIDQAEKQEHDLNDVRCECCGYMTYHREHMGCIKAAYQQAKKQDPVGESPNSTNTLVESEKREWVGLTDEAIWSEYQTLWPFHPAEEPRLAKDVAKFARAIEAKLKEKNT